VISNRTQTLILLGTLAVAAAGLLIPVPAAPTEDRFTLFAATGVAKLAEDLAAEAFAGTGTGVAIETGAGHTASRRIRQGHVPDALITADERTIDRLAAEQRIDPRNVVPLMEVPLVVVIPESTPAPVHEAEHLLSPSVRSIAVGAADTELGRTTETALKTLGLWFELLHRFRPCPTSEIAVNRVRRAWVDAAIVYGTDVAGTPGVNVLVNAIAPSSYSPVRYQAALLNGAANSGAARRFLDYLKTPEARRRIGSYVQGRRMPVAPDHRTRIWMPFLLSVRATCLAMMLAFPLALLIAAYLARGRRTLFRGLVEALVTLPLVIPPVAVGCVLLLLFTQGGPVDRWLGMPIAFTWQSAALAAAVMSFPLAVRPMQRAFAAVDPAYLKAASTLGGSAFGNFVLVVLPLSGRGVLAGLLLAFARAFGEFGATLLVAGNVPALTRTLPQALAVEVESGDPGVALILLGIAVGVAFLICLAVTWLGPERRRA
jgi:molybdate transport system permease protein